MEQFRQTGEVLGSLKALMVFREHIHINQRQCCLLLDMFSLAYDVIAEAMKQNLRFDERNTKWKVLEQPLKELQRVFKEGELYIRQCLDGKDWWAKALTLYQNTDCIDFHIHNLLCCIPIIIESIEIAGENSGWDPDEMQKKRNINSNKYQKELKDPNLFQWRFGRQYMISHEFCNRFDTVWKEDNWILLNRIREKKVLTKHEEKLTELLFKNLLSSDSLNGKLLPSSILVGSKDYQVKRRLGNGSQYKEINWLGESFVVRHFFGEIKPLIPQISRLLSLSHPNIMQYLCGFTDEENKECFLVTELMNRDLSSYIKEICSPRKRIPFSLPVAVDLMLQIARGMEYLHSKKIYHGNLNPSKILVKARHATSEGYLHAKISEFGLCSIKKTPYIHHGTHPFIWFSPEVLAEQETLGGDKGNLKYTEKSDVYSFGMICFELLTGKVPFEDAHLQGEKMSRNIRAGERPLFPFYSPKFITNLTKRCWHSDPNQRPSFSSICRILRYIKRFLVMNSDHSQPDGQAPLVEYCDIEAGLVKKFSSWGNSDILQISQIPFQMFAYKVEEKEKICASLKDNSESGSDGASNCGDENVITIDDPFQQAVAEKKTILSPESMKKKNSVMRKSMELKSNKLPGTPKAQSRPPQLTQCGRSLRMGSESQLTALSPKIRRTSGHASDSELS